MGSEVEKITLTKDVEEVLWRGFGKKSVRQLSEETGIPADTIFAFKKELYESIDELSIQERRMKFMVELQDIADEARRAFTYADGRDKAPLLVAATGALKAALTQLSTMEKNNQTVVDKLNELRIRELRNLIDTAVMWSLEEIANTYELDKRDLFAIFQRHFIPAAEFVSESR